MRIISLLLSFLLFFPCTHLARKPKDRVFNYLNETNPPSSEIIDKTTIAKDSYAEAASSSKTIAPAVKWSDHKRKHVAPKNMPWKRIVISTKSSPAKYRYTRFC